MQDSSLVKWLRWLIYSSSLIPLVIFSQFISPFHFGKVIVFRIIAEVMVALYLMLIWRDKRYLPKSHPVTWAFLAFTLAFSLTSITSVAPVQSWWGTLERMGGLFTFWHYFFFYLIAVSVLRTRKDWQTLINLIISVGLVSALYGFLQRFSISGIIGSGGRERIFGTIGNPALFAGYQILVGYLAVTMAMLRRTFPTNEHTAGDTERGAWYIGGGLVASIVTGLLAGPILWLGGLWVIPVGLMSYGAYLISLEWFGPQAFYWLVGGITLLAAAMTVVRGSLVAMVVATVLYALLWSILFRSPVAKKTLLGAIAAVFVFVFLAIIFRSTPFVQNSPYLHRITDFSLTTTTVQTRFWAWTAGLKGWSENPKTVLVGWGPENFNVPFAKYFNPKFFTGPGAETFFDRAHNMFVEVLVTMGLVGEIAYLALFAMIFATLIRFLKKQSPERVLGIGFIALTVAYMIHNAFIFDTSANFITFFTILAFIVHVDLRGLNATAELEAKSSKLKAAPLTALQQTTFIALGITVAIFAVMTGLRPVSANFTLTRGIVAGWQGDFGTAVANYQAAIDYDVPGRYEYRTRFAQYLMEVSAGADLSKIPDFDTVVLMAIDDVKMDVAENPSDYLPLLYLSRLYIILGKSDGASPYNATALEYSGKALALSPTFVRTYYEIAQAYLNAKQYDKAYEWFKKAADLNPDVGVTYWYLGVVEYQQKNITGALRDMKLAVEKGYGLSEDDALKLIGLEVQVGDIKGVVPLYEQLTKSHPENVQYWTSLAVAYARIGRIPDAVAAVRKAMAINPTDAAFQADATNFLHQLGQ